MRFLSIDVGVKNMAFYIEDFNKDIIKDQSTPNDICLTGTSVLLARLDLSQGNKSSSKIDDKVFENLIDFLREIHSYLMLCSCVIVEEQLYNRNNIAIQLESALRMYFKTIFPSIPYILFSSKAKSRVLGASKNIKGNKLKEWTINKSVDLLKLRNDKALSFLLSDKSYNGYYYVDGKNIFHILAKKNHPIKKLKEKIDDYCDAICQLQAFKCNCFIKI